MSFNLSDDVIAAFQRRIDLHAKSRVDENAIRAAADYFLFRWKEFLSTIKSCREEADFDAATDVCVSSRTLWFSILRIAQLCRPVLENSLVDSLTESLREGQQVSKACAALDRDFLGYTVAEQDVILEKVQLSLENRILSLEEIKNGNPIIDFIRVGTGEAESAIPNRSY